MHCRVFTLLSALGLAGLSLAAPTAPVSPALASGGVSFTARHILSENCFACHGPDEKQRKAGLRLDQPNRAVVAGDILAIDHLLADGGGTEFELKVRAELRRNPAGLNPFP